MWKHACTVHAAFEFKIIFNRKNDRHLFPSGIHLILIFSFRPFCLYFCWGPNMVDPYGKCLKICNWKRKKKRNVCFMKISIWLIHIATRNSNKSWFSYKIVNLRIKLHLINLMVHNIDRQGKHTVWFLLNENKKKKFILYFYLFDFLLLLLLLLYSLHQKTH